MFPSERIHHHFNHGGAVGEVEERLAPHGLRIPVDVGRAIKPCGGKRNALHPAAMCQITKAHGAIIAGAGDKYAPFGKANRFHGHFPKARCLMRHTFPDCACGQMRRPAIQIRTGGSGSRRGIGHFCRAGGRDADAVHRHTKSIRHHLRDFDIEPLAHFRAAVIEPDGPIRINMHQSAGLVQMHEAEGNAKGQNKTAKPAAQEWMVRIEGRDFRAPRCPAGVFHGFGINAADQIPFQSLAIRRLGAVLAAREIARAHCFHILPRGGSDMAQHIIHQQNALRPTKTAKRRVAHHICAQRQRAQLDRGHIVAIQRMGQRAKHHAAGQIKTMSTIGGEHCFKPRNPPRRVKPRAPAIQKRMPLAGGRHIRLA